MQNTAIKTNISIRIRVKSITEKLFKKDANRLLVVLTVFVSFGVVDLRSLQTADLLHFSLLQILQPLKFDINIVLPAVKRECFEILDGMEKLLLEEFGFKTTP